MFPLTKIVLITTLIFLLLNFILVDVFAGAQPNLNFGAGGG